MKAKKKTESKAIALTQPMPQQDNVLLMIDRAARDKTVDVAKMRELLDMQKEVLRIKTEAAFNQAMRDCQSELEPVVRKAENKHTQSKFAKLEHIDMAARPIYTKHGFSLSYDQPETLPNGNKLVICHVAHVDGFTRTYRLDGALDTVGSQGKANKTALQGLGSTISYLRRYLMCMIFNIILKDEDNDGNGEEGPKEAQPDRFSQRAGGAPSQAKSPPIIDQEPAWDGLNVQVQGKTRAIPKGSDPSGSNPSTLSPKDGADYLLSVMGKAQKKASRIAIINENLPLVRALIAAGDQASVDQMHALADKGAA